MTYSRKKYFVAFFISLIAGVGICEYKGDVWEQCIRTVLYSLKNEPVPGYSKEFVDSAGIPFVDYAKLNGVTAGKQYNPTIVCIYAIDYYHDVLKSGNANSKKKFLNCAHWLRQNLIYKNNSALYIFNWQQPWYDSVGKPYTSGMTSGLAAEVFTDAFRLTNDRSYLQSAKALIRGFFLPIQEGGFTYKFHDGWWYEELADTSMHTPFILDGHIFAITGVHEYWKQTKDDSAAVVFQNGIAALKKVLPYYDIGNGWAYYDKYKKPADKKYQRTLSLQMKQLWDYTGDTFFRSYYYKWRAPLSQPYIYRVIKEKNISGLLLFIIIISVVYMLGLLSFSILFFKRE